MHCSSKTPDSTDVVVIGGGGAALIAAIRARELGAEVMLVSKKRPGISSCTAYAGGGFTAPLGGMEPDEYLQAVRHTGRDLNDSQLLQVTADESPQAFAAVADWGVEFSWRRGGASVQREIDRPLLGGTGLTLPLVRRAEQVGVKMLHPFTATRILQAEPYGPALGIEVADRDGDQYRIRAGSVVLATGGAGRIYARTDNPSGIAGDGYALALTAGARLRDMEFVQFHPLGSVHDRGGNWFMGCTILDHVRLTDGEGCEFLPPLMHKWNLPTGRDLNRFARDRLSLAIEQRRRDTGAVYLHLEEADSRLRDDPGLAHRAGILAGDRSDPWRPTPVAPVQHFFSGGVCIDEWAETDVANLFAPGEVAGGLHGANRVGGHALTELLVFGRRAGAAAAERAAQMTAAQPADAAVHPGPCTGTTIDGTPVNPGPAIETSLTSLMQNNVGPMREGESLRAGLATLLHYSAANLPPSRRGPILTGAAVAASALAREESRGCHWREDFPAECTQPRIFTVHPRLSERDGGTVELHLVIQEEPADRD